MTNEATSTLSAVEHGLSEALERLRAVAKERDRALRRASRRPSRRSPSLKGRLPTHRNKGAVALAYRGARQRGWYAESAALSADERIENQLARVRQSTSPFRKSPERHASARGTQD